MLPIVKILQQQAINPPTDENGWSILGTVPNEIDNHIFWGITNINKINNHQFVSLTLRKHPIYTDKYDEYACVLVFDTIDSCWKLLFKSTFDNKKIASTHQLYTTFFHPMYNATTFNPNVGQLGTIYMVAQNFSSFGIFGFDLYTCKPSIAARILFDYTNDTSNIFIKENNKSSKLSFTATPLITYANGRFYTFYWWNECDR